HRFVAQFCALKTDFGFISVVAPLSKYITIYHLIVLKFILKNNFQANISIKFFCMCHRQTASIRLPV
ncbi:hypothetical protein RCL03_24835, partial [Salmonella enterica subsp. enterica serovar 1,4,[5],12:i:-]